MRILFVADIYARPGRRAAAELIPRLIRERDVDLCVANGENAAGGFGMTDNIVRKLYAYGVDVVTSGNHVWNRADFARRLDSAERVLRPLNYPSQAPGNGAILVTARDGTSVGVINLQGRTFMPAIDCPFVAGAEKAKELRQQTRCILVDFHAEATAEKIALGFHLDGHVSAVIGTHTHVQTADEKVLPQGTAFLCDAGMTGVQESVIGTRPQIAVQRFIDGVPARFKPADGIPTLCGALIDIDPESGRATSIKRLQIRAASTATSGTVDIGDEA